MNDDRLEKIKMLYGKSARHIKNNIYSFVDRDGNTNLINETGRLINIVDGRIKWIEPHVLCIKYRTPYLIKHNYYEHDMLVTMDFSKKITAESIARSCGYYLLVKKYEQGMYGIELLNYKLDIVCSSMKKGGGVSNIKGKGFRQGKLVFLADIYKEDSFIYKRRRIECNIKTGEIRIDNG